MTAIHERLRAARVGDVLPRGWVERRGTRRIDATAIVVPGRNDPAQYVDRLDRRRDDFAAWDGRLRLLPPDGAVTHRVLVIDRYGQVYAVHDEADASNLPTADALEEWFRFLATACPECGVLDDPLVAGPTV